MEYRWMTDEEILNVVNPQCRARGWMELNVNEVQPTCRVLGAFEGEEPVGWLTIQLVPVIGPGMVDSDRRDGTVSRQLADKVHEFLGEVGARGALVMCENAVSERLCERHGMRRVEYPVYEWAGGG